MRERQNRTVTFVTSTVFAAVIAAVTAGAQNVARTTSAAGPRLTDAQATALIQMLAASQGNLTAGGLSPAQTQLLSQYLAQAQAAQALNPSPVSGTLAGGTLSYAQLQAVLQKSSGGGQTLAVAAPASGIPQMATLSGAQSQPAGMAVGMVPLAPKRPGVVRLGVVTPAAQMGQGNSASVNVAEPIRALLMQALSGPAIEVAPILALVPAQVEAEAKQEDCDYVLYSSISQKKTGGMGLLSKAMPMASMIPMVAMARGAATMMSTAMTAAAAAQVAQTAASTAASSVKAKNEVSFEYKLMAPGNAAPVLANAARAKAKADSDDVVSPLIQQAAAAILAEVGKKK